MRPSQETRKDRVKEGVAKSVNEINPEYKSHHKFAPPQVEQREAATPALFSSQKTRMDYVTLEGIENRTGIAKEDIYGFVLKEFLDNAVDLLETQYRGQKNINKVADGISAKIEVRISKEPKYLRIVVRNSNMLLSIA
jgi:hypothetical protein